MVSPLLPLQATQTLGLEPHQARTFLLQVIRSIDRANSHVGRNHPKAIAAKPER
jgi:hypothetical protein